MYGIQYQRSVYNASVMNLVHSNKSQLVSFND